MTTALSFRRSFGLQLLVIALLAVLGSAFKCSDLTTSDYCTQLTGCSWSGTACSGTYAPTCVPPNCYYVVDSSTYVAVPDGSVANPYTSVTDAIVKIAANVATVVVINFNANTTVNHWKAVTVSGTIVVQ